MHPELNARPDPALWGEAALDALTAAYGLDPAEAFPVHSAARLGKAVPGSHLREFPWRSPASRALGACHALELLFVFDRLPDRPAPCSAPARRRRRRTPWTGRGSRS
ncbi:hypothetical protein [Streptomyces zaomyceticus]|uniref:hypothetical protein n=1 Tax=Streptomyces zaomyceticus TaxID=68286 RepID=UPI00386E4272